MADNENVDGLLQSIWGERSQGVDITLTDWSRPIKHQEVLYLLQLYPFLQITSSNPVWEETIIPQFHRQPTGWVIHDYGQAMSVSLETYLYGLLVSDTEGKKPVEGGEGEGGGEAGGGVPPATPETTGTGLGTIIKQTFDTAQGMIELAKEKGWPGVEVIAGTDLMKWSAWMAAEDVGLPLTGYAPTAREKEKRTRILKLRSERPAQKKPSLGG